MTMKDAVGMKYLAIGSIACVCLVPSAWATTYYWTGAKEDNLWNEKANWAVKDGSGALVEATQWPGSNGSADTVAVFDLGSGDLTVSNTSSGWPFTTRVRQISLLSGNLNLSGNKYSFDDVTSTTTGTVEVVENSTLTFNCFVGSWVDTGKSVFLKTGLGTANFRRKFGYVTGSGNRPFARVEVREGAFRRYVDSSSIDYYGWINPSGVATRIHVASGATFGWNSYNAVDGCVLDVDAGGTAEVGWSGQTALEGLVGKGSIVKTPGQTSGSVLLSLAYDDYIFEGQCRISALELSANHAHRQIVGGRDSFFINGGGLKLSAGALGFAAGLGKTDLGYAVASFDGAAFDGDEAGDLISLRVSSLDYSKKPIFSKVVLSGYENAAWMNQYAYGHVRPREEGAQIANQSTTSHLQVSNAWLRLGKENGTPVLGSMTVADSTLELLTGIRAASKDDAYEMTLDNAVVRINPVAAPNAYYFPGQYLEPGVWTVKVGARGARWESEQECCFGESACHKMYLNAAFDMADGIAGGGGLTLAMPNVLHLSRPFALKGPVKLTNGRVNPEAGAYDGTKPLFGTGSLCLDNAWLALAADTRLASGAGSVLQVNGSARMSFRNSSAGTPAVVTAGDEDATSSALTFGPGGVLFLSDGSDATAFDGTCGKLVVKGGVAAGVSGCVAVPVYSALMDQENYTLGFLKYDASNGFATIANYVSDLDQGSSSVVKAAADNGTLEVPAGETREIAALQAIAYSGSSWNANRAAVKINAGATLKVGGGNGPAAVLLNNRGVFGRGEIGGSGTLDFGTSDAVIACSASTVGSNGAYPAKIGARIAGSGSVTIAAPFGLRYVGIELSGDNTYSGGTYVSDAQVRLTSDTALGTGPVKVLGGSACSGQLCFMKNGLSFANALEVTGFGIHAFGSYVHEFEAGALWFVQDATLSGPVKVNGRTRIGAISNSTAGSASGVGTFTGVISGGAIQLFRNEKPVVFVGTNTYTGGTEIVSSTLTLRGPCSAGTGAVVLENGTLRLENAVAVSFANDLEGVGTVQLAGSAPVSFTASTAAGTNIVLDLVGTAQTFTALPPFATVTNSSDTVASIVLADGLGTLGWNGRTLTPADKIDLSVGTGTTLDLGGETLTVRRLGEGSRARIVNGEVVEIKPKQGLMLIVR